jgi:hypothetical protein
MERTLVNSSQLDKRVLDRLFLLPQKAKKKKREKAYPRPLAGWLGISFPLRGWAIHRSNSMSEKDDEVKTPSTTGVENK